MLRCNFAICFRVPQAAVPGPLNCDRCWSQLRTSNTLSLSHFRFLSHTHTHNQKNWDTLKNFELVIRKHKPMYTQPLSDRNDSRTRSQKWDAELLFTARRLSRAERAVYWSKKTKLKKTPVDLCRVAAGQVKCCLWREEREKTRVNAGPQINLQRGTRINK